MGWIESKASGDCNIVCEGGQAPGGRQEIVQFGVVAEDCVPSLERPPLSSVLTHPFRLRYHVPFHGAFQIVPAGSRFYVKLGFESIQLEKVAVGLARRRTRATITDALEVVLAL